MVPAFKECANYGQERGVIIGLQHHDDFLKTAGQTIRLVKAVDSDWFILDVGSVRQGDPYKEIEKLLPYASKWQIKEHVWYGTRKVDIDIPKLSALIEKIGYRGFAPIRGPRRRRLQRSGQCPSSPKYAAPLLDRQDQF